jgi:hypothetical protein
VCLLPELAHRALVAELICPLPIIMVQAAVSQQLQQFKGRLGWDFYSTPRQADDGGCACSCEGYQGLMVMGLNGHSTGQMLPAGAGDGGGAFCGAMRPHSCCRALCNREGTGAHRQQQLLL